LAAKECKEYEEATKKISESIASSNAAAESYAKAREQEIALLKTMMERYKTTDKLEKAAASAEKKKAKATPSQVGQAEAEYNQAKQAADTDRMEVNSFGKQNIKQALLLKQKALLDYHIECAKQAQIQFDIANSM